MQLRRSPGGSMFMSWRRRPEDPPSSVTLTTAARSEISERAPEGLGGNIAGNGDLTAESAQQCGKAGTPPMATTRSGFAGTRDSASSHSLCQALTGVSKGEFTADTSGYFRVEQLGKARIVHHALEVVIGARLQAVARIQLDGA